MNQHRSRLFGAAFRALLLALVAGSPASAQSSGCCYNLESFRQAGWTDTQTFSAAMTALTNGGALFIPPNQYTLTTGFTIPPNVHIFGAGPDSHLLFQGTSAIATALTVGGAGIQIDHLRIGAAAPGVARLVYALNQSNLRIHHNSLEGAGTYASNPRAAICLSGVSDVWIEDNSFSGNGDATGSTSDIQSNFSGGTSYRLHINHNRVSGDSNYISFELYNTQESIVSGNTIDQNNVLGANSQAGGYGIMFYTTSTAGTGAGSDYNTVSGNVVINTAGTGIYLQGSPHTTVVGNVLTKTVQQQQTGPLPTAAISVNAGNSAAPKAIGTVIDGNTVENSTQDGIAVSQGDGVIVANNNVRNTHYGIHLWASENRDKVMNNLVLSSSAAGLRIDSGATYWVAEGNTFNDTTSGYGVADPGSTSGTLRNNWISGNSSGPYTLSSTTLRADNRFKTDGLVRGVATLSGGTVSVSTTEATTGSMIRIIRQAASGPLGELSLGTLTDGVSFVINSNSASDNSTVLWEIVH